MLQIPPDAQGSHEAVIALVEKAFSTGLSANLRVVVAKEPNAPDAAWRPACARLDLARDGHPCPLDCRPRGPVRVLEERIGASEFVARLRSAYAGDAFRVCDDLIAGHGFDLPLVAYHHPDDWRDYGSEWPCIVVAPSAGIRQRPYLSCCIEDDGPAAIFNGLEHLVRHVMAFAETPGAGIDVRFSRFQILIWDYRGRIDRLDYDRGRLTVEVTPKGDRALKLIGFAANGQVRIPIKEEAPTIIEVPIAGAVANAEVAVIECTPAAVGVHGTVTWIVAPEATEMALLRRLLPPAVVSSTTKRAVASDGPVFSMLTRMEIGSPRLQRSPPRYQPTKPPTSPRWIPSPMRPERSMEAWERQCSTWTRHLRGSLS